MSDLLRRRYRVMLQHAEAPAADDHCSAPRVRSRRGRVGGRGRDHPSGDNGGAARLIALRADGTIGDAAFQQIEQEMDLEELYLQQLAPGVDLARTSPTG